MFARVMTVLVFALAASPAIAVDAPKKPNVLFIAVDDLNHWVGHLNRNSQTKTPNLDRLAKMGVTFTRAYCAAPACNPARAALMSGLRPNQTGVYDNAQDWKPVIRPEQTLTTQFKNAGYGVYGAGKIYHNNAHRPAEWDDYFVEGDAKGIKAHPSAKDDGVGGIKFKPLDCKDSDLSDAKSIDYGIKHLQAKHEKPFFLAVGLHKPHMPWDVPKSYYDMFPLDSIKLPPTMESDLGDIPAAGVRMAKPTGDHAEMLKSGRWKEAIQAYLATIAYADAQIGRLIDALEKSPHKGNTVVVLWGDHGWHLGEKEHWRKFALWEEATRAPLVWVVPGVTNAGGVCDRPVDHMSIFPTLCEVCGVSVPKHAAGPSLKPLLADPKAKWDHAALTTHNRNNHAVRTEKWRYIRYADGSEELYDHENDEYEWKNLASDSKYDAVKKELAGRFPTENAPELPRNTPKKK